MKKGLLSVGLLVLIAVEILRVYYIMPFPGSQQDESIGTAYWLHNNITWIRIAGWLLIAYPVFYYLRHAMVGRKILLIVGLALYAGIFYLFNFRFLAEKMFYQPRHTQFADAATNKVSNDKLVIGVVLDGTAKAYPIQLIGYHHQVQDSIGNKPVMVTYCTVCRTGRVFSPFIKGKKETFRLVGMDHFNALFEDATTHSWWRQVNGVAVAGPLKGQQLQEIPSSQTTLAAWVEQYPQALVFQPDTFFSKQYEKLALFDKGTIAGGLEKRDSASWNRKSWVIGVEHNKQARAYDWNDLQKQGMIQDSLSGLPLLLTLEKDSVSFHAWSRQVDSLVLQFTKAGTADTLIDTKTASRWTTRGLCVEGVLKGTQLSKVQSYQEFWHSWSTFHPATSRYTAFR